MALGDLYQQDVDRSLSTMAAMPPDAPQPDRSAWGAPWRAVKAAAAEVLGSTSDMLKAYGAASAMTLEADPVARAALGDKAVQQGAAEGRRQIESGEALVSDVGRSFRQVAKDQRPDPATASKAEQIVFGVVRPVSKLVAGGMVAGPFGIVGAAGEEGFTQSEELREQGVDFATRSKIGALTAGVNAAGAFLPMAGPTLKATAGLYLLGGPGAFMAQQQATRMILQHADYGDLAKQYDPLDPTGLALSALIPLPFAAHGAVRNIRAARGSNATAKPEVTSATPVPTPEAGSVAPEVVDAAMTHNLTLQQDIATAGMPRPETAQIPRADHLPPVDRAIENRLVEKLMADYDAAAAEYATRPDSMGGKVLNTDIARELSPDYLADRTRSAAVHEPASWFIKQLYADKLSQVRPGDDVVFTSGGTGAGKTTAIESVPAAKAMSDSARIVYDTNMNSLKSAVQKIQQALDAGAEVHVLHVQRDPVEALVQGALPRAMRQAREFGTGRTVPLTEHARTHRGAAEVIQQLAERYKDDPRVHITVIDNTRGKGGARLADLGFVRGFDYNGLEGKLYEALKQEHDAGRISEDVFRATEGPAGFDASPDVRPGNGRGPQRGDGSGAGPVLSTGPRSPAAQGGVNPGSEAAQRAVDAGLLPPDLGKALQQLQQAMAQPDAAAAAKPTDSLARLVVDRVAAVEQQAPDLVVRTDENGKAVTVAEEMARVRQEVAEGTDAELGTLDADLVRVAAECAVAMGST